jgi:hypothetical protein
MIDTAPPMPLPLVLPDTITIAPPLALADVV